MISAKGQEAEQKNQMEERGEKGGEKEKQRE